MGSKFSRSQASSKVRKKNSGLAQVIIDFFKKLKESQEWAEMNSAPQCSSLSSPTASWWSRGSFFTISRMSDGLRVAMRPTCATWWSGGIAPRPFHWTLVTFETRYSISCFQARLGALTEPAADSTTFCFTFRSPSDFSHPLLYVHETTIGVPPKHAISCPPSHAGHVIATPRFNAKTNRPRTFLPFPQHPNCPWD